MNKTEVKNVIVDYLKRYNITHTLLNDHDRPIKIDDLDTIVIGYPHLNAPGGGEQDIRLYDNYMWVRAYYGETVDKIECDKKHLFELLKVINFMNNKMFFDINNTLYDNRFYYDGYDHVLLAKINYEWFEANIENSLEYITCYMPEAMEKLAMPLIAVQIGEIDANMAIYHIKKEILGEEDALIEWKGKD